MNKTATGQKVSLGTKLSYGIGCVGRDANYTLFSTFLLTYLTLAVGLNNWQLAALGVIFFIGRIWDGINDPLMGIIIDNTNSRWGKFKPYIIIGAIGNAVCTILLFSGLVDPNKNWTLFLVIFSISYLLWDITFTMNDIGYWSMLPSLTTDIKEREGISGIARIGASVGLFAATALIPMVSTTGNLPVIYRNVAIVIAIVFVACQVLIIFGVKEQKDHITQAQPKNKISIKEAVRIIFKNDQLIAIIVSILLFNTGYFITTGFGVQFFYFDYGNYKGMEFTFFALTIGVAQILTLAFYPLISKRLSRKQVFTLAIILVIIGYVGFMGVGYILPMNMISLCIIGFILFSGQAMIQLLNYVLLADTVEYGQWKFGTRNEGILFSLNPLIVKFASAVQALVFTVTMIVSGLNNYNSKLSVLEKNTALSADEIARLGNEIVAGIPSSATLIMRISMIALPMVLIVLSYIVYIKKYKITKEFYQQMITEIEERSSVENAAQA